jgi:hypothetical protein
MALGGIDITSRPLPPESDEISRRARTYIDQMLESERTMFGLPANLTPCENLIDKLVSEAVQTYKTLNRNHEFHFNKEEMSYACFLKIKGRFQALRELKRIRKVPHGTKPAHAGMLQKVPQESLEQMVQEAVTLLMTNAYVTVEEACATVFGSWLTLWQDTDDERLPSAEVGGPFPQLENPPWLNTILGRGPGKRHSA